MNRIIRYTLAFSVALLCLVPPSMAQANGNNANNGNGNNANNGNANANNLKKDEKNIWSYVTLWTGAKLENPYSITVDPTNHTAKLQSADTKTDGYLELRLQYRFVDRVAADANDILIWRKTDPQQGNKKVAETKARSYPSGFAWQWDGTYPLPDIDTSIGYVFRKSSSPTNFNSSTIVGGSDLYVNGSLGFPYWRYVNSAADDKGMRA